MALDKPVRRIAIVGTGVIGASWAAEFLAKGFDVIATDPAPNAEANLRKYVDTPSCALTMRVMQPDCKHPDGCVIGHPFNPPHMIPLVEVVGGEKTSPDVVRRAIEFYASIGKKPIHLRKEVVGHVANRLQAAIYREVVNLINLGVVDVADADTAVCWGPGLRWGVM